jgi:hypothetical protein
LKVKKNSDATVRRAFNKNLSEEIERMNVTTGK